jgi:magnesium transporter
VPSRADETPPAGIPLSRLRRFAVVDARGRKAVLVDLAVALLRDDHPPVTRLLLRGGGRRRLELPWSAVASIQASDLRIDVADLGEATETAAEAPKEEVLLCREVQDALILDLQNRRTVRANDLLLHEEDGCLRLHGADASLRAVLRRLTRGRVHALARHSVYDWKYVEFLRGDPRAVRSGAGYHLRIAHLPAGEIARLADFLPYLHAAELVMLLPDALAADTLESMTAQRQLQVFEELDDEKAVQLLKLMAPDLAADLVARLQTDAARRYLGRVPPNRRKRILELLRYPEETVGAIMTNDVVVLPETLTVVKAREALKERLKEPDFIYFVYVVDAEETRRLRGVLTLRDLLVADDGKRLQEIMNTYILGLRPSEGAREAAYRVVTSQLAALPVLGEEGRVLGAVTVDAALARVAPRRWVSQAPRIFS